MSAETGSNLAAPSGTAPGKPRAGSTSAAGAAVRNVVRDRDQLAWALAHTAEFVVEGDPELAHYAARLLGRPADAGASPTPLLNAAPNARRTLWRLIAAVALAVPVLAGSAYFLLRRPGILLPPPPVTAAPVAPGWSFDGVVQIGWVVVALVAVIAIYRLISKAIEGDRNVELAWKITEKASGRLVIKKVPIRSLGR